MRARPLAFIQVSSILIRIDKPGSIDGWGLSLAGRSYTDKQGQKVKTEIVYSDVPTTRSKAIWRTLLAAAEGR